MFRCIGAKEYEQNAKKNRRERESIQVRGNTGVIGSLKPRRHLKGDR